MLTRQPGPFRDVKDTLYTADMELFEEMDDRGFEPGDDMTELFGAKGQ